MTKKAKKASGDIPADIAAERALLGALLIDPSVAVTVRAIVQPSDFYLDINRSVYEAILGLVDDGAAVDALTVSKRSGVAIAEVVDLLSSVPTALHAEDYARAVKDAALRRQMIREAERLAKAAYSGREDPRLIASNVAERLLAMAGSDDGGGVVSAIDVVREVYDRVEEWMAHPISDGEVRYLPTGLRPLDKMLRGLRSGLYILAARPSMGKTALALQIASNVARSGRGVLFFSLEMAPAELVMRLACSLSGVSQDALERGEVGDDEYARALRAMGEISSWPLRFVYRSGLRPVDVRAIAAREMAARGLDLVIVDGMWLMTPSVHQENRNLELGAISDELKHTATDTDVPLIAIHQLSRSVEQRGDKRPILADLRESGRIEENADVVLMLYREGYYDPTSPNANVMEIWVRKNRFGGPANVKAEMAWIGPLMRLEELAPRYDYGYDGGIT